MEFSEFSLGESVSRNLFVGKCSPKKTSVHDLEKTLAVHDDACQVIIELAKIDKDLKECVKIEDRSQLQADTFMALKDLTRQIDNSPTPPAALPKCFWGTGGFATLCYIKAYLGRFADQDGRLVLENGSVVSLNPEHRIKISGKIRCYQFSPTAPGSMQGNGHLVVDVIHREFATDRELIECKPSRTEAYKWRVEFCDATVFKRDSAGFPDLPFPDLQLPIEDKDPRVVFPEDALDPNVAGSLWCRGLDHKIFAGGPDQIKVRDIYLSINEADPVRLDDDHTLYKVTEDSCVDLMFKGYPPFDTLPPQREYCLGRCAHPPLVNSGGD